MITLPQSVDVRPDCLTPLCSTSARVYVAAYALSVVFAVRMLTPATPSVRGYRAHAWWYYGFGCKRTVAGVVGYKSASCLCNYSSSSFDTTTVARCCLFVLVVCQQVAADKPQSMRWLEIWNHQPASWTRSVVCACCVLLCVVLFFSDSSVSAKSLMHGAVRKIYT